MTHRILTLVAALLVGSFHAVPAHATDVGVSVQISQPGVYGRIDIGQFPRPQVVVAQPVIVVQPPMRQQPRERVAEKVQPVYLWVPPGHRKNWRRHCRDYGACGVPVLFVDDRWYDDHVHPRGKNKNKGHGHDDHDGHGHGKGNGKGNGNGGKGKND